MNRGRDNDLFPVIVILVTLLVINTASYRNGHDWGDDFSQYIFQAKSLVDGTTDRLLEISTYRYNHSENKILGPALYPWGYPIILSPAYALFGLEPLPMKVLTNLFFLFSLGVIFLLFRGRLGRAENYLVLVILSINPALFEFKDSILSDFPFMFFCLTSIFFMQRFIIEKKPFLNESASNALLGLSLFASCAVRGNGIILIPTLLTIQIVQSLRATGGKGALSLPKISHLIPYGVFAASTYLLGALLPSASSSSYSEQLGMLSMETITTNVVYYMTLPSAFFTTSIPKPLDVMGELLFLLTIPLALLGVIRNFRDSYHYIVFTVLTIVLFISWPGTQGLRFIFPIIPFYLFFIFAGLIRLKAIISIRAPGAALPLTAAFAAMVIFLFGIATSHQMYTVLNSTEQGMLEGPYTKDSIELFRYISDHTRSSDVVIFSKPRAMSLYTQRRSILLMKIEGILASPARYIVCRRNGPMDLMLRNFGSSVRKVFQNREFVIYRKQDTRSAVSG